MREDWVAWYSRWRDGLAVFARYVLGLPALALTLLLPFSSLTGFAQFQCQSMDTRISADNQLEVAASDEGRSRLGGKAVALNESYPAATEVWRVLLRDVVAPGLSPSLQWRLLLVDDGSANAFSLPDGEVLVDRKLASLLGKDRGLWAALLSHEIAHVAYHHWLRRYSCESKLQERPANFGIPLNGMNGGWRTAAFDQQRDVPGSLSKFSHDLEFEADTEGMTLMARSGFHPDFELELHHLMDANFGDTAKLVSTFSTHPGWKSRERNSERAYREAVREFDHRWSAAESSPGGAPPTVVFLGEPKSSRQEPVEISFPLRCMNPGQELRSVVTLYERAEKNGAQREAVEFWKPTTCNTRDEKKTMTVTLTAVGSAGPERKGQIRILDSAGVVLERSDFFTIHSDRKDNQRSSRDTLAYKSVSTHD